MRRRDRLMEWAAGLLLPVLIGLAGVLSYSALRTLALEHGYAPWEASLWPLVVDVFALVTMLTAMTSARRHYGPSLEAWMLTAISVGVTVLGNLLSAPPNLVAQAMRAWPALALMGAWHVWVRYASAQPGAATNGAKTKPAAESATSPHSRPRCRPPVNEAQWLIAQRRAGGQTHGHFSWQSGKAFARGNAASCARWARGRRVIEPRKISAAND